MRTGGGDLSAVPVAHAVPKKLTLFTGIGYLAVQHICTVGAGVGEPKHITFIAYTLTSRAYQRSRRAPVAFLVTPPAVPVLATSRPSQWPP